MHQRTYLQFFLKKVTHGWDKTKSICSLI